MAVGVWVWVFGGLRCRVNISSFPQPRSGPEERAEEHLDLAEQIQLCFSQMCWEAALQGPGSPSSLTSPQTHTETHKREPPHLEGSLPDSSRGVPDLRPFRWIDGSELR